MTIRVMFKNGKEFSIKCKKFSLEKNAFGVPTGYSIEEIAENKPVYLNFEEINAIVRVVSDELSS